MRNFERIGRAKQKDNTEVKFQSGMTSEQKFHSIADSVLGSMTYTTQNIKGCPMHPKISKKCRKCQEIESNIQIKEREEDYELDQTFPELIKINTNNVKSHFNEKLQNNIENAQLFKTKLKNINNVRDLVNDLTSDQISIDTYIGGSTEMPTVFFCYFYRLAELRPTREQLSIMLRANNVNVRCLALLYIRVYADPTIVYGCMQNSFKDNKLLTIETIGQYAMRLLDDEKLDHGGFRLPRLPLKIQRAITKKINQLKQHRQKEFQRERERSRQKERKRRQQEQQQLRLQEQQRRKEPSSQSEQQERRQPLMSEPTVQLSLKEKIKLIEQKKANDARRKAALQRYKTENVNKLQSQEQGYSENDSVQKFQMG